MNASINSIPSIIQAGDMQEFGKYFRSAREADLGVTMHIAEVFILLHFVTND